MRRELMEELEADTTLEDIAEDVYKRQALRYE